MEPYTILNKVLPSLVNKSLLVVYSVTCESHSIVLTITDFWLKWSFMGFQV